MEITSTDDKGRVLPLSPGTCYAVNHQETLVVRATTDELHTICVFNPPFAGSEQPNENGIIPATDKDGNELFEFDATMVDRLFEPPSSLKSGTCKLKDHPLF